MADLKALRDERGKLIYDARALLDGAEAEKRDLTDEERAKWDALITKSESIKTKIEAEERMAEIERDAAAAAATRTANAGDPANPEEHRMIAFRKGLMHGAQVLSPEEQRALQVTPDSSGGYLVPPVEWVNQLIKAVDNMVHIRQRATVLQVMTAQSLGVPSLENDPADANWTTELATGSEDSTMSFGNRELVPHPLAKLLKVSNRLLQASAMPAEALVRDRLAYKFAVTEEKAFLTGTGASQPLGVFTASNDGIGTARDVSTGNSTTEIKADNLIECKYTLKGQYWATAEWMFHRDGLKQIAKLKDGDGQYIWRESYRAGEPDRLLGLPVAMSEYAPNTFTTGLYVGILMDWSTYFIADALAMQVQRLVELYAATNQVGFIGRLETDGMPTLAEAAVRVKLA